MQLCKRQKFSKLGVKFALLDKQRDIVSFGRDPKTLWIWDFGHELDKELPKLVMQ